MTGLRERFLFSRALSATLVISILYTVANFTVPFLVQSGAAAHLDGSANVVDNAPRYSSFDGFSQAVYLVGDAQCHQMGSRSLWLNGNQMPMDARMTSMYLWANLGLLTAMFTRPSTSIAQGLINALPARLQSWGRKHFGPGLFAGLFVFVGILPVAVDGFVQLWTPYESANLTRFLTGIPTGWIGGLLIGVMMTSIRQVGIETQEVRARVRPA